jgi:hypothetical protein
MTCPDIYINPFHWTTPHAPSFYNAAIDVGAAGNTFDLSVARPIIVTVGNHGTDSSPLSRLQLYWADPSTGFIPVGQIGLDQDIVIVGNDGFDDGVLATNFSWTPTQAGHFCLLARIANVNLPGGGCATQGYDSASPYTDARSAIHNVFVVSPAPFQGGEGGEGEGRRNRFNFAFAATNTLRDLEDTKLEIRALDPKADREKLRALVTNKAVQHALCCGHRKFRLPEAVLVAEGRERVIFRPHVHGPKVDGTWHVPRIGHLGPVTDDQIGRLVLPGTKAVQPRGPVDLKLHPGEMRQMLVQIRDSGKDEQAAFAIEVTHQGADGRFIGGLILVCVPPLDVFD